MRCQTARVFHCELQVLSNGRVENDEGVDRGFRCDLQVLSDGRVEVDERVDRDYRRLLVRVYVFDV
jgi:hypothetical protein